MPWLMVSLSMLIVGAGIAVGFLIQSLLPSYKNTIITVTDVPEIKQMLYVENTEELIIFPGINMIQTLAFLWKNILNRLLLWMKRK